MYVSGKKKVDNSTKSVPQQTTSNRNKLLLGGGKQVQPLSSANPVQEGQLPQTDIDFQVILRTWLWEFTHRYL